VNQPTNPPIHGRLGQVAKFQTHQKNELGWMTFFFNSICGELIGVSRINSFWHP